MLQHLNFLLKGRGPKLNTVVLFGITGANACTNTKFAYFRSSICQIEAQEQVWKVTIKPALTEKKKYFLKICINIHGTIFRCYPFSQVFFQLLRNHSYPSHLCHFSFHLSRAECSNKLSLFFLSWKRWDSLVSNTSGCGTEKRKDLGEPPGWHSDAKIWFSIR